MCCFFVHNNAAQCVWKFVISMVYSQGKTVRKHILTFSPHHRACLHSLMTLKSAVYRQNMHHHNSKCNTYWWDVYCTFFFVTYWNSFENDNQLIWTRSVLCGSRMNWRSFVSCCSSYEDDIDKCIDVVFIHQSRWQQRMLMTYGTEICLIDATYRTTSYDLPLVCLCVATNVGYSNVATMVLVDEKAETIAAGLRILASWNPAWKPKYFMSDFHEGQISALEVTFPGLMSCS